MATIAESLPEFAEKKRNLVETNWDPITRIVGSLGIFTKIDFENREVAECYSTSSIFRGYSMMRPILLLRRSMLLRMVE
jgi:hydrogenase large subunit